MVGRKAKRDIPPERDVRERLIVVATELFARKGYATATTREIVAAAGVTKPVLYYYFRSKEGIYLELMQRAFKRFEDVVEASITESGGAEERLLHLCDQVFSLIVEKIDVVRLMYSIYYGPPQGAPFFDFDAVHLKLFESILQIVNEGIRKKEFRRGNADDMTWAILGAMHIIMENEFCHPELELGHDGLERILNLIFRGISIQTARRGKGGKR